MGMIFCFLFIFAGRFSHVKKKKNLHVSCHCRPPFCPLSGLVPGGAATGLHVKNHAPPYSAFPQGCAGI